MIKDIVSTLSGRIIGEKLLFIDIFFVCIIIVYAFTPFVSEKINSLSKLILCFYFFYLFIKNFCFFRKDRMTILFFIAVCTQIITWGLINIFNPELSSNLPDVDRLGKLFLFIPIAWGLRKINNPLKFIFIISLIGFCIGILTYSNFKNEIISAFNGHRVDFGIRNAQHVSMLFGVVFIVSLLEIFTDINLKKRNLIFLFGILIISIFGLIFTQTRQSYLAVIISVVTVVPIVYKFNFKFLNIVIIIVVLISSLFLFKKNITNIYYRFDDIRSLSNAFICIGDNDIHEMNFDEKINFYVRKIPSTSSGVRIKSWLESSKWIVQKPFFGWGSKARSFVIKKSTNLPDDFKKRFGHLHNYFIEVLVSYGLIGLLIILYLYIHFLISIYKMEISFGGSQNVFVISLCFVVYWMVINNFESFNSFSTGVFVHNIFLGVVYSRYLHFKCK